MRDLEPARSIPAKEFEIIDPEVARFKAALQTWASYGATADRHRLQLVLALFDNQTGR